MRAPTVFLISISIGCGSKTEAPPSSEAPKPAAGSGSAAAKPATTGSGSGSGSATTATPPPASGACFEADSNNQLSALVAGDKSATICVSKSDSADDKKPPVETCLALDYAAGTFARTTKPAPATPATGATIKETAGAHELCQVDGKCVKLAIPKPKATPDGGDPEKWIVGARGDGAFAVAAGGGSGAFHIFDGKTGKKKKSVKFKEGDYSCLDGASYLGETIYITGNVCAGPGGGGFLFDGEGKKLGQIEDVNVFGATPVPIGGTTYAFSDFGTAKVALVDVKTGKRVKVIEAPRPDDCDDCDPLGDASTWNAPSVAKRPDGKLVALGGHIAILDPASGKVDKTYRFPVCKAKTP